MSRFADVTATRRVDLGACLCPGTPHDGDYALVRAELSTPEIAKMATAADPEAIADVLAAFIVEWNLLGPDGTLWPATGENILRLKPPTLSSIVEAHGDVAAESSTVPNASGAPSPASPRESASRTRRQTRTPGTSS